MSVITTYHDVMYRIKTSAHTAGRDPQSIKLVAVSKTFTSEDIAPLLKEGHRHFGENRVQESMAKWPALRKAGDDIVLHMIGPLQSNKAHNAVTHFDVIHTLDRPSLAEKLADEMGRQSRRPLCLIQVNTGREPQKAGIDPADADMFIVACRRQWNLPVEGLMCIPPAQEDPSPHFAFLRELGRRNKLRQLSMGMSADYDTAIAFGATYVRVGSAIFGARPAL